MVWGRCRFGGNIKCSRNSVIPAPQSVAQFAAGVIILAKIPIWHTSRAEVSVGARGGRDPTSSGLHNKNKERRNGPQQALLPSPAGPDPGERH